MIKVPKLQLYIGAMLLDEWEINIPSYKCLPTWDYRAKARITFVSKKCNEMIAQNHEKVTCNFHFILIANSDFKKQKIK